MPRATLSFKLLEERIEHQLAMSGAEFAATLFNLDDKIGRLCRKGHAFKSADEALAAIRAEIRKEMEAHNVSFEMME